MEKERGLTKRKIEETGVNQQPKCKSQAIFLSFYFKSSFNLSGLINIDILNLLAYKQICALYFTKLILPSSNKIFGMQLIATDNNLDSSRSLYKQTNKHSVHSNTTFLSFNFQTKHLFVGQHGNPCEPTAKCAWGIFSPSRDIPSFLLK